MKEFKLPKECICNYLGESGPDYAEKYKKLLKKFGLLGIRVAFDDRKKEAMKGIISRIGKIHEHNSSGSPVWDIRYEPEIASSARARSQTLDAFEMHTDASFEERPPEYFAMYVIVQDRMGGGRTIIAECAAIISTISEKSRKCLQETKVPVKVPPEFYKGKKTGLALLVHGMGRMQFRRDTIIDSCLGPEQKLAVDELESAIRDENNLSQILLPEKFIIVIDNSRFLHGRTKILDPRRHLQRIRFDLK